MMTSRAKRAQAREVPARVHRGHPGFDKPKADEVLGFYDEKDPSVRLIRAEDAHNVVPTRFVCTWKMQPDGSWKAKARLVAIGFRDGEKHLVDVEADTPARETTRYLFHLFVQLQWRVNKWDAKQAFMGSGRERPWRRRVCLKPPAEAGVPVGWVWEALRAVYGLGDGPREWNIEWDIILVSGGMTKIQKGPVVFLLPPEGQKVPAGVTLKGVHNVSRGGYKPDGIIQGHMDDFLWGGEPRMHALMEKLRIKLRIGLAERDSFMYLGLDVQAHFHSEFFEISVGQAHYIDQMEEVPLDPSRSKKSELPALPQEYDHFREGLGKVGWVAGSTGLYLALEASLLPRRVTNLQIGDLVQLNKAIRKAHAHRDHRLWFRKL